MPARASDTLTAPERLRAFWSHRQGLDGSLEKNTPAEILSRAGWARSVGGAGPYLTLFSRARTSRERTDADVAALAIHELPSARGCTYVVPASDFALALALARGTGDDAELTQAKKHLGVTDREIERLCKAVLDAVAREALDPREIKTRVGDAARDLGPAGKKRGMSNTLPIALGLLQTAGEIRRVPIHGRLDQQRFRYARWESNPAAQSRLTPQDAAVEIARKYFAWAGPATLKEFQWFTGFGVARAREAVAPLALAPVAPGDDRLVLPEDLEAFRAFDPPSEPHYRLVSSLDSLFLLRRNLATHLDAADAALPVFAEKGTRAIGQLTDLESNAIVDRGRLIGLWEYDPGKESIVWATFRRAPRALADEIERTEQFVRAQLGDVRAFSLDSPESRAPRIAALRKPAF